jgi:3-oxoacyl-[acyl-carrier-protein] synthase II
VNAHGTSTPLNDSTEAEAIRKVFGDDAPPVTSTKGVTGHLIGAAGATEAVISLLAMRDGLVPPTANVQTVGDDIGLDIVFGTAREIATRPTLSNSFGFGGHNATLILAPAE